MSVPQRSLSMVLGRVTTLTPSARRRFAVLWVPLPPRITRQSSFRFFIVFFMASTLSTPSSPMTRISLKGQREVPSIVPPRVRIPEKSSGFIRRIRSWIRPRYPSRIPWISTSSNASYSALATPLIAAFRPWQSPPLVNNPILNIVTHPFHTAVLFYMRRIAPDVFVPIPRTESRPLPPPVPCGRQLPWPAGRARAGC